MMKNFVMLAVLLLPLCLNPRTLHLTISSRTLHVTINRPVDKAVDLEAEALRLLKELEGFTPAARWDVNAYRNGYGTPAREGEKISPEDAERRALKTLRKVREKLLRRYGCLTDRQSWALSLTAYNVGGFGERLDAAARSADNEALAAAMSLYVKSQGVMLPGLETRRAKEIEFLTR